MSHWPTSAREGPAGPLTGIRVLDLSAYIAGPYGCTLLADQGADVIKVEPPSGDNLRQYPSTMVGENRAFLGVNRSKLGIALDLKTESDRALLLELVGKADVLVHNFRPAVPERLGVGYEALKAINPRLIYCAVTGFGDEGEMAGRAGYDQVLQAMTGMCVLQGPSGGPPELTYGSPVDYYAAALVAAGVASALFERERSGEGQYVGVSLLRSALTMQSARLVRGPGEQRGIMRDMRSGGITGLHPTKEGWLYLSANTPHFWRALCTGTGLAELADDPAFDTVTKRAAEADRLVPLLREQLRHRTAEEWEDLLADTVPCSVVRPVEDMFDHPQVLAEDIIADIPHPNLGTYQGVTRAISYSRTPGPAPFAAPTQDADRDYITGSAGPPEEQNLQASR